MIQKEIDFEEVISLLPIIGGRINNTKVQHIFDGDEPDWLNIFDFNEELTKSFQILNEKRNHKVNCESNGIYLKNDIF
jgi:hypothetical protein